MNSQDTKSDPKLTGIMASCQQQTDKCRNLSPNERYIPLPSIFIPEGMLFLSIQLPVATIEDARAIVNAIKQAPIHGMNMSVVLQGSIQGDLDKNDLHNP